MDTYSASAASPYTVGGKQSYARKLKRGETSDSEVPSNVQKATAPLQHTDWMMQNQNLPMEPPRMPISEYGQDRYIANFDHCSFENAALHQRRSRKWQNGMAGQSQMGSFYAMNPMASNASMYGGGGGMMAAPPSMYCGNAMPPFGSMYGGNSMYGPTPY